MPPVDATVEDVLTHVTDFHTREGAQTNRALYVVLFNRSLDDISARIGGFSTYWSDDSTDTEHGTLQRSGAIVTVPSDLLDFAPGAVLWGDLPLDPTTENVMDYGVLGWRSNSGTPGQYLRWAKGIVLDTNPGAGKGLVIWGKAALPHYVEGGIINPLSYLPLPHQLSVADPIIARLPLDYRQGGLAEIQLKLMAAARQEAAQRWAANLPLIIYSLGVRSYHPLGVG